MRRDGVRLQPRGRYNPSNCGAGCRCEIQMYDNNLKDEEAEFDDGLRERDAVGNSGSEHEHSEGDDVRRIFARPC